MKKYKYLFTFLLIFLMPIFVNAECTSEELRHFQEIESEYRLEYEIDKGTGLYKLIMYNPDPGSYTYNVTGTDYYFLCEINSESDTICNNVLPGGYRINIVGNTKTCDDILKRNYLSLKPYNRYSEDPLCEDIKEFSLCQETYDKEIDYETFVSRVQAYKENKNQEQKNNSKKKIDISKIQEYLENNLFQVIVVTVFVILVIITIVVTLTTAKKSRRLE